MSDQPNALKETQRIHYYRPRPAEWMVQYLGIRPETLWWSMNEGYGEDYSWDSTIQFPGEKEPKPCPNPLVALVRCWAAGYQQIALQSAVGTGKAQPVSEPVQTPSGPVEMGEIEAGDFVVGLDGTPTEVVDVFPQGERSVYKVSLGDGSYTYCDGRHLWALETTASRSAGRPPRIKTATQLKHELETNTCPCQGYWVPTPKAVQYPESSLPVDPYVLGVLIGDGGLTQYVGLSSADEFIIREVEKRTEPYISVKHRSAYDYGVIDEKNGHNRLKDSLEELGLFGKRSEEKFIPKAYQRGSVEQRLLLLQGLMDTDGTTGNGGGSFEFTSSSEQLVSDVRRLVWSLGGTSTKRRDSTANEYLGSFTTAIRLPNHRMPFRLPRKADKVKERSKYGLPRRKVESVTFDRIEETKCIKVAAEDSMYLTRDFIPTHNTYTMSAGVLHYLDTHRPSIIKTYAPTEDTLEDQLFGYMGEMFSGMNQSTGFKGLHPQADKHKDLNVYMRPESESRSRWKASGDPVESYSGEQAEYGSQSAAGAQGAHAEWMTLIIEEAPGVHSSIWNALDFTLTDERNQLIAYGNPDSENDPLNKFAQRDSTLVIRVSGLDHPNYVTGERIVPGAFGQRQPERMLEKYNGDTSHPMYKSRVRGICPRTSGACLFKEQALESVEKHFRKRGGDGERLADQPWKDPLFKIEHDPGRWRPALLRLAEAGGWTGAEAEGSVAEEAEEEALGIYDVEGHTDIYAPPDQDGVPAPVKFDSIGRYCVGLDVAGDYAEGDAHAGFVYDRIERHVVAEIHLRGPREAYALMALALAKAYHVPYQRDPDLEAERDEDPQAWMAKRYLEAEREVRKRPTEISWPGRKQSYPKLAWETNGVGALHKIGPFKGYPNKYYDKNPDVRGGKRSRRMGWQTTRGQTGSRTEMVENLRDWHHLLAYDPRGCPSEGLLSEMKAFKRNKDKDRYEAETGEHDDRVMALGICLIVSDRMPSATETKAPDPTRKLSDRARRAEPDTGQSSIWSAASERGTWSVPNSLT